jgi:acyl-CoA thioesterase-1
MANSGMSEFREGQKVRRISGEPKISEAPNSLYAPKGLDGPAAYGRRFGVRPVLIMAAMMFGLSSPVEARTLKIVALGDSLTAGFGLPADFAFPVVLQKALRDKGLDVDLVNGGVSGDTSAGLLARLDWTLGDSADGAIVEIGANDMLRGAPPDVTEQTIDAILSALRARKIPFLLAGMRAAPNLGGAYAQQFEPIYRRLAAKYQAPLYPFFLEGVAGVPGEQLPDGLHPNRAGVERIVGGILPLTEDWLKKLAAR